MSRHSVPPSAELPESAISELHARYRAGATTEPGGLLDQRILAAARADLTAHGATLSRPLTPWWKAWLKPASVLAVAVLGLSLTWQVIDQQEADRRQELGSVRDQPRGAETTDQGVAVPPPAAAPATSTQAPVVNTRVPAPAEQAARVRVQAAKPAAHAAPLAFPEQESRARIKDNSASSSVERSTPVPAAPAAPAEKKMRADETDVRAKREPSDATPSGTGLPLGKLDAGRRDQPPAATTAPDALGKATAEAAGPQDWVRQIRALRAAGRDAEAAQSLSRFRVRYPDFVLPDDLNALK